MTMESTLTAQGHVDIYVDHTETVIPSMANPVPRCRFYITYKGESYMADFSPDDENSDLSIIEFIGPKPLFNEALNLVNTVHRDQFQAWYAQHLAQ